MSTVKLVHVNKVYGKDVLAVKDFNIDIQDKEFIVFVGPSGCGKSTTLRMIAGLEEITSGELYIDGKLSNDVAPKDRNLAMVFQSYALYPHMTVYKNMAFGLKIRKVPKAEIDRRVREAAEILGITEYLDRKPAALSGGQRQRVALGRAIVRNCGLFLMDEPLSNLDAKLRVQMRSEIVKLHKRIGCTTIYVTHDQTEAMTMADRIVVMKKGVVQQIGTPDDIYHHPVNRFVAGFIGSPAMNFFEAVYSNGHFTFGGHEHRVSPDAQEKLIPYEGRKVLVGIRPENIACSAEEKEGMMKTEVDIGENLGSETYLYFSEGNVPFVAKVPAEIRVSSKQPLYVSFEEDKLQFFDPESEESLLWKDNGIHVEEPEAKTEEEAKA